MTKTQLFQLLKQTDDDAEINFEALNQGIIITLKLVDIDDNNPKKCCLMFLNKDHAQYRREAQPTKT
jgi:hypothetical protein